ncbi:MAG: DUF4038 domain-containing protein [Opitutaceae bacterium]|nr:DUF4038 domain-containing protein [Opitutaceae bacterium]
MPARTILRRSILAWLLLAIGAVAPLPSIAAESSAPHTWQRWEHTLISAAEYANPYADVTVQVKYTGPDGRSLRTFGFWDGGQTFRIRCAFPVPGKWQWETECSDSANRGLHQQRGNVNVLAYAGGSPLYRRGFLQVSANHRYLTYGDGTPYLWLGDTAWAVPHRATDEEWEAYLADRVAKGFSVIQVGTAPAWAGPADRSGEKAFREADCAQWNPTYWQSFERKIQRANEKGLVVFAVGLMEPTRRYPPSEQACLFGRNLVARLFGNFVIFSPSFDSRPMPLAHEVGHAVRAATTVHLVTQHPGTPSKSPLPEYALYYVDQPYVDFSGLQTGHNGGDRMRSAHHAIEWVLHLYHHTPPKPVINIEAMYDGQGVKAWQAVDARGLAWRSWLSGAMGYTYGAGDVAPKIPIGSGGVWRWVTDPAKYDYWEKALQWESAFQMQHLRDFMAAIRWWELEPAHELIRNQPEDVTRRMVLARVPGRDFAVAYLPNNDGIDVDVSAFSSPLVARWFDPVHGRTVAVPGNVGNRGVHRFVPPGEGDWVLVLGK